MEQASARLLEITAKDDGLSTMPILGPGQSQWLRLPSVAGEDSGSGGLDLTRVGYRGDHRLLHLIERGRHWLPQPR